MKAFSLNCSAYLRNESFSCPSGKWGLPSQEAGQLNRKALISSRYQTVNLCPQTTLCSVFFFFTVLFSDLLHFLLYFPFVCLSALFLSSKLSFQCFLPLSPCLFLMFLISLLTFSFPFLFSLCPVLTSVGPFASNNPRNSRVIEKQLLSGGTSWRKACNKKIGLDDQNSLSFMCVVCVYMCICTVMALCPAAAECMDSVSRGLTCPLSFPTYTHTLSACHNIHKEIMMKLMLKNDVPFKKMFIFHIIF